MFATVGGPRGYPVHKASVTPRSCSGPVSNGKPVTDFQPTAHWVLLGAPCSIVGHSLDKCRQISICVSGDIASISPHTCLVSACTSWLRKRRVGGNGGESSGVVRFVSGVIFERAAWLCWLLVCHCLEPQRVPRGQIIGHSSELFWTFQQWQRACEAASHRCS